MTFSNLATDFPISFACVPVSNFCPRCPACLFQCIFVGSCGSSTIDMAYRGWSSCGPWNGCISWLKHPFSIDKFLDSTGASETCTSGIACSQLVSADNQESLLGGAYMLPWCHENMGARNSFWVCRFEIVYFFAFERWSSIGSSVVFRDATTSALYFFYPNTLQHRLGKWTLSRWALAQNEGQWHWPPTPSWNLIFQPIYVAQAFHFRSQLQHLW